MSNPFAVELERRRAARSQGPEATQQEVAEIPTKSGGMDPLAAGTEAFSRELIGQLVNLPGVALETLARGLRGAGIDSAVSRIQPGQLEIQPEALQAGVGTVDMIVRNLLRGQRPDPSAIFDEQLAAFQSRTEARRESSPVASTLGRSAADAATLALGRIPMMRLRRALPAMRFEEAAQPTAFRRTVARFLERPAIRRILRGTGRSTETGLEGATLAILDREDPTELALYSAGAQTAGSLSLEALRQMRQHPIAASVFLTGATLQVLKEATPGGRDRILESLESAASKVPTLLAVGGLAGAAGTGRVTGPFSRDFPKIADAITALPRGAMLSLLKEATQDEEKGSDEVRTVLETFVRDPSFFGKEERRRLSRAIQDPNRSVRAEVSRMLRVKKNRQRFERAREMLETRASGEKASPVAPRETEAAATPQPQNQPET